MRSFTGNTGLVRLLQPKQPLGTDERRAKEHSQIQAKLLRQTTEPSSHGAKHATTLRKTASETVINFQPLRRMRELKLLLPVNAPQEAFGLPASARSTHAVKSTKQTENP